MKLKQKITFTLVALGLMTTGLVAAPSAYAAECGGVQTAIISCKDVNNDKAETSAVWKILLLALQIMTAGVGILAVGGIVYGSVLYTTAGDKSEQTKKAITIITNVVIGIVAYGLMYTLLNFLIPGGIFDTGAKRNAAGTAMIIPLQVT